MWQYAESALKKTTPNYDLRNCVDIEAKDRLTKKFGSFSSVKYYRYSPSTR